MSWRATIKAKAGRQARAHPSGMGRRRKAGAWVIERRIAVGPYRFLCCSCRERGTSTLAPDSCNPPETAFSEQGAPAQLHAHSHATLGAVQTAYNWAMSLSEGAFELWVMIDGFGCARWVQSRVQCGCGAVVHIPSVPTDRPQPDDRQAAPQAYDAVSVQTGACWFGSSCGQLTAHHRRAARGSNPAVGWTAPCWAHRVRAHRVRAHRVRVMGASWAAQPGASSSHTCSAWRPRRRLSAQRSTALLGAISRRLAGARAPARSGAALPMLFSTFPQVGPRALGRLVPGSRRAQHQPFE